MDNEIVFNVWNLSFLYSVSLSFFIHLEAITHIDREQIEDDEEDESTEQAMIMRCTNSEIDSLALPIHEENEQERYEWRNSFIH